MGIFMVFSSSAQLLPPKAILMHEKERTASLR